jgi:hypothetical protein
VRLQLENVLAGVGMRRREEDREAAVDRRAVGGTKRDVRRVAGDQRAAADRFGERRQRISRRAHDADRAAPARGRDRDDRIVAARELHRRIVGRRRRRVRPRRGAC